MITIKEELENYSYSKIFSNIYYLFKSRTTTAATTTNTNGQNKLKKSPLLRNDDENNDNDNNDDSGIVETITDSKDTNITLKNRYIECTHKKTNYSLNNHTETPDHLIRPFIYEGYRVDFSYLLSFKSIFIFGHNDFSNIHSHLIPAIYFLHILYNIIYNDKYNITETSDKIMFSIFLVSAICTFVCSVLYHTFGCHSYSTYKKLLLCDYLGIILLIGSSFYPSLFYTYRCYTGLMVFYMFTITSLCVSLMALIFVPRFQELHTLRNTLFSATALFGVFPALHTFFIFDNDISLYFVKRIFTMFLIFGLGLFFYIYKLPESVVPFIGEKYFSSHSIWHVFTALGPLYHLDSCLLLFHEMAKLPCQS